MYEDFSIWANLHANGFLFFLKIVEKYSNSNIEIHTFNQV